MKLLDSFLLRLRFCVDRERDLSLLYKINCVLKKLLRRMIFDDDFIKELFGRAKESDRQRQNFDLRTSTADQSQRMMNALLPGT